MKVDWQKTCEPFRRRWCTVGIDLSSVSDLTCVVYLFPYDNDREHVDILMRSWCPERMINNDSNKYREQYRVWEREGWLVATDGDAVDYNVVLRQIVEDSKIFDIGLIGIDAQFQGQHFANELGEKLGHSEKNPIIIACRNTLDEMTGPILEFERRLLTRKLNHGGNPLLRFMVDSVGVKGSDGKKKIDKDKSQGKIDGVVSSLYALGRLIKSKPPALPEVTVVC